MSCQSLGQLETRRLIESSRESFDLVHLKNSPPWSLSPESKVTLLGAHGSDIVRSFCFLDAVSTQHSDIECD
jgi:hypothetical protein